MTYGVVRAFQVIVNTLESSPEKAGVGGSTPSLATIILNNLAEVWRKGTGKITHGDHPCHLTEILGEHRRWSQNGHKTGAEH
jgi:hypothetical protein